MREGTGNCSLFSWALEDALLRFVTHSRYNFGTFEKRERRWFSVYATPAKAFSVFPNLLCKQGAAGSSPATSTNLFPFKKIAREPVPNTTCYAGRRLWVRITWRPPPLLFTSPSLMLHFRLRTPRRFQEH